jgi:ATP-dependent RNA helicase DeaD
MERKNFDFSALRFAVLDEADIMLNLGFKEDVEHIMRTIKQAGP